MTLAPSEKIALDLGRVPPAFTPVSVSENSEEALGIAVVSGSLYCFDREGNLRWKSHPPGLNYTTVVETEDLDGDGKKEILLQAGRSAQPFGAAVLLSLETGEILWRYDVDPMSYSWKVYVDDYLGDGTKQIVVVMHGYPPDKENGYIAFFAFDPDSHRPVQKWRYDFDKYTCFPSLLRTDMEGDGQDEICVETHSRMWFFDTRTGKMKQFVGWDVSPGNVRSYGFVGFTDLNGDGLEDFLCIATFSQHHEVLLNRKGVFSKAWGYGWGESVTTGKVVTTWPSPPYADVDGDGTPEVVVSMFNSEKDQAWLLRVYDAVTGKMKFRMPGVIASSLVDVDGDGDCEIACNLSSDPTRVKLNGAVLLDASGPVLEALWKDEKAQFPPANQRGEWQPHGSVFVKDSQKYELVSKNGTVSPIRYEAPKPEPQPVFKNLPDLVGPPVPDLLAADLSGDGTPEVLLYSNETATLLEPHSNSRFEIKSKYSSTCLPVLADLNGDGRKEFITGLAAPDRLPVVEAHATGLSGKLLWRTQFPEPGRPGLPQPRKMYMRTGFFTGKNTPDLYVWVGTPVVRSVVLDGLTGRIVWEKGEVPNSERYWGPSMDLASTWDFNGDGKEDLVFTNPDYYCIADGQTGDFLLGPLFPKKIFNQESQGLYTFPAILPREGTLPLVCLVAGHYFQAAMSMDATPLWYKIPLPGEAPCGVEGFLKTKTGEWLMGFGRQDGSFACLKVSDGTLRWRMDVQASCSDTITMDVDGDGRYEFVFGTSHGDLYAVGDGGDSPRVVWQKKLPTGTGNPIAADLDSDGKSEIIVPLTDGTIRVLDGE